MKLSILASTLVLLPLLACGGAGDPAPAPAPDAQRAPLVEKRAAADWCKEHGVPESVCTRCNAELIPKFKAQGDWCETHGLPKSQCVTCDPALFEKLQALAPKDG